MHRQLSLVAALLLVAQPAAAALTERVSVGVGGAQSSGVSYAAGLSADGSLVAFATFEFLANLPAATNGTFIRDRAAATTTFVSPYEMERFTPDFATAAFSTGDALVPDDTNNATDVYVIDVTTHALERVSVASDGSQANRESGEPALSADGNLVAFRSYADNLVVGDTNGMYDIFVHDRLTGTTERVSVAWDGSQADGHSDSPAISGDGRFVAFASLARNLVPGGTDGQRYAYIHDRMTGSTELVSILPGGSPGYDQEGFSGPALSADGNVVAFAASDQIYARDRVAGATDLVSATPGGMPGNADSLRAVVSADGRFVGFSSEASDLIAGDTNGSQDVFLRDRVLGTTERVSVATDGSQGTSFSFGALVSGDGRVVGFTSDAGNLVPGDVNVAWDAFVRDRTCGNGVRDGVEECDDGRNDDGDGCDANCTVTRCGNGRPTPGEACDDGGTNGMDQCCTFGCQLVDRDGDGTCDAFDRCTGSTFDDERLLLSGFSGQFGKTPRLALKGHVTLPAPISPPLDPLANGVRLLIVDTIGLPLLDVTIPGGPPSGSPTKGWTTNGTTWRYKNADKSRFPDAIRTVLIGDQSARVPGRVRFAMRGELHLDAFRMARFPIRVFLFLHPPDDAMAECGEGRPACVAASLGDRLTCR